MNCCLTDGKRVECKVARLDAYLTLIAGGVCWLLANLVVDRVFDKLILANIPIASLAFALLGGFYWKRSSRVGAYLSMVIGWGFGVGTYL